MTVPPPTSTLSGERIATSDVLPTNGGKSPLPPATLNHLWTLYAETHMAGVFGGLNDAYSAQGVRAGIVATLLAVLPEEQFREVMIRWEVDAIRLTQLLHVAGVWTVPSMKDEAAGKIAAPLESSALR